MGSRKGGLTIKDIVYDTIISVIVLALLVAIVIPLFHGNMALINAAAGKVNEVDKVYKSSMIELNKGVVKGSDVVSAIRYFSDNDNVEITVSRSDGNTKTYIGDIYAPEDFYIGYEAEFYAEYFYDEGAVVKIQYTEK